MEHNKSNFQSFFKRREILESCVRCLVFGIRYTLALTHDTGYLIPELTSFEERLKIGCLDATIISTAKKIYTVF